MIKKLGFTDNIKKRIFDNQVETSEIARVVAVHKERYIVRNVNGTFQAEITGNLRYSANNASDFPAVGDWVKITQMDEKNAIIFEVCKRISKLERQAVGKFGESQLIATNIDFACIVMAVDRDFNLKRLDRYVSICSAGHIQPVVLLTKTDLIDTQKKEALIEQVKKRHDDIFVYALSINNENSIEQFAADMEKYKTYCFIGSSGAGKSTLINFLFGDVVLKTSEISQSNSKGRHTTSHRELFLLPNESIVIDTPGMREVGIVDSASSIDSTFDQISDLADNCRFEDCTHTTEKACAVLQALNEGIVSESEYENYLKLKREQSHFAETVREKKKKGKNLSKVLKDYKGIKKDYNL